VALALALLVAFVPITATQALPLASGNDGQANAWVTSFGQHLSHGERVLFFPYPSPPPGLAAALAWQAEAKFSYSILGGYLATPSEPTTASNFLVPPRGEEGALIATGAEFGPSPQSKFNLRLLARAINHRHPTTIVVVPTIQYGPQYAATVTALLGRVPGVKGHTLVWRNVTGAAVHRGDGEVIAHCSATVHSIDLRAVPHCVVVGQHQRQR
jgi:hypothetical protein